MAAADAAVFLAVRRHENLAQFAVAQPLGVPTTGGGGGDLFVERKPVVAAAAAWCCHLSAAAAAVKRNAAEGHADSVYRW